MQAQQGQTALAENGSCPAASMPLRYLVLSAMTAEQLCQAWCAQVAGQRLCPSLKSVRRLQLRRDDIAVTAAVAQHTSKVLRIQDVGLPMLALPCTMHCMMLLAICEQDTAIILVQQRRKATIQDFGSQQAAGQCLNVCPRTAYAC